MKSLKQRHFYHMVTPSPWPFLTAFNLFVVILGMIAYMHKYSGIWFLCWGVLNLIYIISLWLRDVIREGTYEGMHTIPVQRNLRLGFALFIVSEIMFFFGFFVAYFYVSLSPAVELGCIWPPVGINPISPWRLPLLNTLLLLLSGVYITICHMYIRIGHIESVISYYLVTLLCGLIFTCIQVYEYIYASFTIADSVYGSIFYLLTGFHGLHVFCGSIFIIVNFFRTIAGHFSRTHHIGFECAAWYWHFVDVVWLFSFIFVYVWGNW